MDVMSLHISHTACQTAKTYIHSLPSPIHCLPRPQLNLFNAFHGVAKGDL